MIIINVKNSCAVFSLKNRKLKRDFEIFLKEIFCPWNIFERNLLSH